VAGVPSTEAIFSLAGARQGSTTRLLCTTVPSADEYAGVLVEDVAHDTVNVYSLDVGQANWTAHNAGIVACDVDPADPSRLVVRAATTDGPSAPRSLVLGATSTPS